MYSWISGNTLERREEMSALIKKLKNVPIEKRRRENCLRWFKHVKWRLKELESACHDNMRFDFLLSVLTLVN